MQVADGFVVDPNYKESPPRKPEGKKRKKQNGKRRCVCGTILSSYNKDDYCCPCLRRMALSGELPIRVKIERGQKK